MYWLQSRDRWTSPDSAFARTLLLAATISIVSFVSHANGTSAVESSSQDVAPDLSGIYASSNGISATVYQPTNQQPWVIRTIYADGTPVTLYLRGSAESLVPSGMDTEVVIGGESMHVVARDGRVYAATGQRAMEMEVYRDESGTMKTVRGGKLDAGESPEAIEARMAIEKVVDDWAMIRRQVVHVRVDGMRVSTADAAAGGELNFFTRVTGPTASDAMRRQELQEAGRSNLDRVADFEARLHKAELRN